MRTVGRRDVYFTPDVVVGIAGSGKTTALAAATTALEDAGFRVIGTATSGQAARTSL